MSSNLSTTYIGTIQMGRVTRWKQSKESSLTPIPFPSRDSHMTEAVDTLGVVKFIEFSGRFTGKFGDIQAFIGDIYQILDGYQLAPHKIYSPFINGRFLEDPKVTAGVRRQGRIAYNTAVDSDKLIDANVNFNFIGVKPGDIVRNLRTGEIAYVRSLFTVNGLILEDGAGNLKNLFTEVNTPYAVSVSINVKILKFEVTWELPGLSYCDYDIELIQVR